MVWEYFVNQLTHVKVVIPILFLHGNTNQLSLQILYIELYVYVVKRNFKLRMKELNNFSKTER